MNLINTLNALLRKNTQHVDDNQQKLLLLFCLPCYLITAVALILAQISPYLIAFILIILALLCSYVIVASQRNSQYQIRTLSNLIESMIDGDYTLRARTQANPAYQELLNLINNLSKTLAKHKLEAKESRLLLERIMEQMDAMVLATDERDNIVMANASANELLLGNVDKFYGMPLASTTIGCNIMNANAGLIEFNQTALKGEHFLFTESFLSDGKRHQLYLLTNAERLLMEKERKAWQSLLRVLSHEMNNSLTPIASISQSMQSRLKRNDDELNVSSLLEGISIINERADSLGNFIASYSQLSHLPLPVKASFSLSSVIDKLASLFPDCHINVTAEKHHITADKNQIEQVLINLFKNAHEAMLNNKNETVNESKTIEVKINKQRNNLHINIYDTGKGVANLDNIFVPFYTTKPQGSGIGLALCRQILFNHNGTISLANREDSNGAMVSLVIPQKE